MTRSTPKASVTIGSHPGRAWSDDAAALTDPNAEKLT